MFGEAGASDATGCDREREGDCEENVEEAGAVHDSSFQEVADDADDDDVVTDGDEVEAVPAAGALLAEEGAVHASTRTAISRLFFSAKYLTTPSFLSM